MRPFRVWKRLLGIHRAVIEDVQLEPDGALVVSLRPKARERDRCPHCRRRCPGYDWGEGTPAVAGVSTAWWSPRCRGRGTTRASRAALRTRSRGLRFTRARPRCRS